MLYASLDELCANDSTSFFTHRPAGHPGTTTPFQPPPESFSARPRNGPINISSPYGGVIPKQYSSYAPALPISANPPQHQFIHPSISPPAPPPVPLQPSSSTRQSSEQKAQEFFHRQNAVQDGCQSAIEHIRVCKVCRNKLELIQEKEDSANQTIDNILEIATFVSAGLFFVYMMDSIMNLRRN